MVRISEQAEGKSYPQLTREQIDYLIGLLMIGTSGPGQSMVLPVATQTRDYLIGYYTKRWGLPPALQR